MASIKTVSLLQRFMDWLKKGQITTWRSTNAELDKAVTPDLKAGKTHPHLEREGEYNGLQVKLPLPEGRE